MTIRNWHKQDARCYESSLCVRVCFILEWYISMNIGDKLNMFLTWFRFQVMEIFIKMIIFRFNGFKVRSFASSSFMFYVRMRSLLNEICICLLIIFDGNRCNFIEWFMRVYYNIILFTLLINNVIEIKISDL